MVVVLRVGSVNGVTVKVDLAGPHLAWHLEVNGVGLGVCEAGLLRRRQIAAVENVKRVRVFEDDDVNRTATRSPHRILDFMELKTVWHPAGV